jgi:hypothetical protein
MPTVPVYGPRRVNLNPLVGARLDAVDTPEAEGAGLAQAQGQGAAAIADRLGALGATAEKIGVTQFADLVQAKQAFESSTRVMTADRQLGERALALTQDPQTGAFGKVKGADTKDLLPTLTAAFDDYAGTLETDLSDTEKIAFRRARDHRREALRESVASYTEREMGAARQGEENAQLDLAYQTALSNTDDLKAVGAQVDRAKAVIGGMAGLGPDARADLTARTVSKMYDGVIRDYLARGLDQNARVLFDGVQDQLVGTDLTKLREDLSHATTAATGLRAAEAIWSARAPQNDNDPIEIDRMEDAARSQFGNDPKVLDQVILRLRERKAAVDASRKDRQEAMAGSLFAAAAQGASLDQLRRMPQYLAAPGKLQAELADYVVNRAERQASRAYSEENRAYTRAQRIEAEKEQAGWARYFDLAQPDTLAATSENALNMLRGNLGDAHVNRLIEAKRRLLSPEAIRAATVDRDQLNAIAQQAGMRPYQTGLTGSESEEHKAEFGRLEDAVKAAIDDEQRARGNKEITREDKGKIMQAIVDRRVMLSRWGTDPSIPAAMIVNPKDRENAYVKLADIPQTNVNEAINLLRARIQREQTSTREQMLSRYGDRIQRAYAAHVLKLGADEELRRLLGQ